MANNYFEFKQFTVFQDKCAMKVCTDACLFGAIVANYPSERVSRADKLPAAHCLDIGTGTGLLSLMLAQKDPQAYIDAVEIDINAAEQAKQNFAASPWKERLTVYNTDILSFGSAKKYDLIISNPPFFEDDLLSPDETKNKAKHDLSLGLAGLLQVVREYLTSDGTFAVMLPGERVNYFIEDAIKAGLYLTKQVLVKQTENHGPFRGILFFSRMKGKRLNFEISIKDSKGNYSTEFEEALKDYYLYL